MGLFLSSGCLGCADSFLFRAGKAVFRPVACNQVRGARGRGQGTEMQRNRDLGIARMNVRLPPAKTDEILPILDRWAKLIRRLST